jgi:thioesterase domain-containing protein
LAAYVVPVGAGAAPGAGELREYAAQHLPEPLVPTHWVTLDALPRTATGKLDRASLPAPGPLTPGSEPHDARHWRPSELALADVWADVLGLEQVGIDDNFFDLGGHSLLVARAVARARDAGLDLGVADFYDVPTVAGLARAARPIDGSPRPTAPLAVTIRRGDVTPAVFCVHADDGGATSLRGLATHLDSGQQFHGLQARGLVDEAPPLRSIEAMADAYVAEVMARQPGGPYLLAAWSFGGYVALEMARRLAANGRDVAGLFLLGPPYAATGGRRSWSDRRFTRRLLGAIDRSLSTPPDPGALAPYLDALTGGYGQLDGEELERVRAGDTEALRALRVAVVNGVAKDRYVQRLGRRPRPHVGRVVLVLPDDDPAGRTDATVAQWRRALRREPQLVVAPGDHRTIVRGPGAEFIGRYLAAEVDRARHGAGRDHPTEGS